jgi:predicted esterase
VVAGVDGAVALVLLHGRGRDPSSMHALAAGLGVDGAEVVAPAAPGGAWYPERFTAPRRANEPALSRALEQVWAALDELEGRARPPRIVLGGFSQGACLACEALARRPRRVAALAAICGGLIGADDDELARPAPGTLDGVPALLTAVREDGWVPVQRVARTAQLLAAAGAQVQRLTLGPAPHAVHDEEVQAVRGLIAQVAAA